MSKAVFRGIASNNILRNQFSDFQNFLFFDISVVCEKGKFVINVYQKQTFKIYTISNG